MLQRYTKILLILVFIIAGYCLWTVWQWERFLTTPMLPKGNTAVEFEIKPGTSLVNVALQLKQQNLLSNSQRFIFLAQYRNALGKIKAGEYLIAPGKTTPWQFLNNIMKGKIILRQVTIIEGWNFAQTMQAINNNPYLVHSLIGLDPQAIMQKLGEPNINPEGQFYPDTYLFGKGTTDFRILQMAHQKMENILAAQWQKRQAGLPYATAYQALIAASLIEKETAVNKERPLIAGVILNRLAKNMRLQIDPTVIYALGPFYQGKLTSKDMMVNSPYNTYRNAGLPPTPIAMPAVASIYAALHPTATDALYYVANRKGGHIFSQTLQAHDVAIKKYLLAPRYCTGLVLLFNDAPQPL